LTIYHRKNILIEQIKERIILNRSGRQPGKERTEAMRKKRTRKALEPARAMPALRHSIEGQDFDVNASEVINWLMAQESIKLDMFNLCREAGLIAFDPVAHTWSGATAPETPNKETDHECNL